MNFASQRVPFDPILNLGACRVMIFPHFPPFLPVSFNFSPISNEKEDVLCYVCNFKGLNNLKALKILNLARQRAKFEFYRILVFFSLNFSHFLKLPALSLPILFPTLM